MIDQQIWLIVTALASTVSGLAVYINRLQNKRIGQLEVENAKLQERLNSASERTLTTSATLERVVNASVDREKMMLVQLASAVKDGGH